MPNKIHNVLFDLDGTLADTAPDLASAVNKVLKEHNKGSVDLEIIRPAVSLGGVAMVSMAFGIEESDPQFKQISERFLDIYSDHIADETQIFPGMDHVLDQLDSDNISWGIVTNKSSWLTLPLLQALELDQRAGCIISGDTLEHKKPHPAPMLHACELLSCDPATTVYVGDAQRDIAAGLNAGMHTIVARYGYIGRDESPETWGADAIINTPKELLDWL